jgi:hypothetical protein
MLQIARNNKNKLLKQSIKAKPACIPARRPARGASARVFLARAKMKFIHAYKSNDKIFRYFKRDGFRCRIMAKPGSDDFAIEYAETVKASRAKRAGDAPKPAPAATLMSGTVAAP